MNDAARTVGARQPPVHARWFILRRRGQKEPRMPDHAIPDLPHHADRSAGNDAAEDNAAWLAGVLARDDMQGPPAELAGRLAGVGFLDLLGGLQTIADRPDRRLARALYRGWIEANPDTGPHLPAAWFNLGAECAREGDRDGAMAAWRAALALQPGFYPAAVNLGLSQEAAGDRDAALATWRDATQPEAARCALLNQRARLLEQTGRLDEAERLLCNSLAADPAQPDAIQHWVHLRQRMCRWPVLAGEALGLAPADLLADCGPLAALSLTDRVAMQTAITARWVGRKTVPAPYRLSPAHGYAREDGGQRIVRLGYLSSDFGRHAMGYLIAELFERHDRDRFSVHGYCLGAEDGSAIRARIRSAFDGFAMLGKLSDEAAARAIAADEIDILIDLNGLTQGARPQILRFRPAPIQATYLGFVGPVPLPELDYLFCDDAVVPPASAAAYRPAPLPIAPIFQANDARRVIGAPTSRAAQGLAPDAFVFCCFSNHYKITQKLFGAWMRILAQVPGSVLWLAADNAWSRAALSAEAERAGVAPSRLIVAERTDPADYISRLAVADLFLDTFPYNAGTVASDALRMGLPLLTQTGEAFASRMAARLLAAIGATEGIAATLEDYVRMAVTLGSRADAYSAYKARFSLAAWQATIGDSAGFTAAYEAQLLAMHAHHRARAPLPTLEPTPEPSLAPLVVAP
jgi:predicted O-linked N-acetylglucosamine transferase (SPINDLY family)